ncbi:hypothetical protein EMIHUDRAFT_456546, partial [Emiliania huxleyi CCMP1516]|uniref:Uncharacterized protein n=5 Tax=Emiliania huxleyi TaxID=2903 RepID=A0A0D3K490_EMIH1
MLSLLSLYPLSLALATSRPPVGAALEAAVTPSDIFAAAERIDPPYPPYEFSHRHMEQDVHQRKRQSLASNALGRLSRLLVGGGCDAARSAALRDARLPRLLLCAAVPSASVADGACASLDTVVARHVATSLAALAALCAADAASSSSVHGGAASEELRPLCGGARLLADRADALAERMSLASAVSSRWAARRLFGTDAAVPRLDARAAELPYDVLPGLVALPAAEEGAPAPRAWLPSVARLAGRLTAEGFASVIPFEQQ